MFLKCGCFIYIKNYALKYLVHKLDHKGRHKSINLIYYHDVFLVHTFHSNIRTQFNDYSIDSDIHSIIQLIFIFIKSHCSEITFTLCITFCLQCDLQ